MSLKRLVIAGAGSGVGKTTIATGIMSLLSKRYRVQAFKVGPDFIDPMFHSAATGRPSRNLDSFFMDAPTLQNLFGWATSDADIALVEGVRGLYDGLTSTGDTGSTAEIAKLIDAPVILVVNARSLAKSAAAHVLGFKMLDPSINLAGVILNQVSGERHRQKAVEAVETLAGVPVIGTIERKKDRLPERHLGLITIPEDRDVRGTLNQVEDLVSDIDLEQLLSIAETAREREFDAEVPFPSREGQGVKFAVPKDKAFSFYYPENLESIKAAGAEIEYFRPVEGDPLPEADAYYIGGGYPEVYGKQLSENKDFLDGLKTKSAEGKLIYGECGGMMVMCHSINDGEDKMKMAGIFPCASELTSDRQGLAYVQAEGTEDNFLFPGEKIRAHEFHYSRVSPIPSGPFAYNVLRGRGIDGTHDGMVANRSIGTYMHQHALSNKNWGISLVAAAN